MIPVTQTKVSVKDTQGNTVQHGNCYAAAVASLLEVPISEVPNVEVFFQFDGGYWQEIMLNFLQKKGYEYRSADEFKVLHGKIREDQLPEGVTAESLKGKYYLVSGLSARGVHHITIYQDGKMVHDPHPTKDGLLQEEFFEVIEPLAP